MDGRTTDSAPRAACSVAEIYAQGKGVEKDDAMAGQCLGAEVRELLDRFLASKPPA